MSGLREERHLGMVLVRGITNLWTAEVSVGAGLAGDEIATVSANARRLHRWQGQLPQKTSKTVAPTGVESNLEL